MQSKIYRDEKKKKGLIRFRVYRINGFFKVKAQKRARTKWLDNYCRSFRDSLEKASKVLGFKHNNGGIGRNQIKRLVSSSTSGL